MCPSMAVTVTASACSIKTAAASQTFVSCSTTAANCSQKEKEVWWVSSRGALEGRSMPWKHTSQASLQQGYFATAVGMLWNKYTYSGCKTRLPQAKNKIKLNIHLTRGRKGSSWNSRNMPREAQRYVEFHIIAFFELVCLRGIYVNFINE